jgi:hypothetical protein
VVETWFTSLHNDNLVINDGYSLFRKYILSKTAGGVAVYVRDDIVASVVVLQSENLSAVTEVLGMGCNYKSVTYYVAGSFHPPKARYSDDVLKAELARDLEILLGSYSMRKINQNSFVILIAGDFNSLDCSFIESDFGLEQIVNN